MPIIANYYSVVMISGTSILSDLLKIIPKNKIQFLDIFKIIMAASPIIN